MATAKPIFVVAGIGNGTGIGASTARLFAKRGFRIALMARNPDHLKKFADEIKASGGEAAAFPVQSYVPIEINAAFSAIKTHFGPPTSEIRAALWNATDAVWKPFLDITEEDVQRCSSTNTVGAFAFARAAILSFQENKLSHGEGVEGSGKRGTLIFTGATASLRGNVSTSLFSVGKFGIRSLSQSLNKEFGKQNIHVAHSIIDGGVLTDRARERRGGDSEWEKNENVRLNPDSVAKSYQYLISQDSSAMTWEIDLRPAHEKW